MATRQTDFPERIDMVLRCARGLPNIVPGVMAIGLAGSWARGTARDDSDVDLVVLTTQPAALLERSEWFENFGAEAQLIRSADFGAIQERRLALTDSTVVEIGIGGPEWACPDPIDAGTHRVVADGFQVLYDRAGLLAALVASVRAGGATGLYFRGVRSVMVFAADPEASSRWWGDLLATAPHADGEFRWLELPTGVELAFHPADEEKNPFGASTVAYWQVDSVHESIDCIVSAGGLLHRGPLRVSPSRHIAQVRDPFGAVLGLDGKE